MNETIRICLAGPPGSGKSTVLSALSGMKVPPGNTVLFIGEAATGLIRSRTAYIREHDNPILRQFYILRTQLALERTAECAASDSPKVIICDRGVYDAFVYLDDDCMKKAFTDRDLDEIGRHFYDRVFYFLPGSERQAFSGNPDRLERDAAEISALNLRSFGVWHGIYPRPEDVTDVPVFPDVRKKAEFTAEAINGLAGRTVFDI